MTQSLADIQHAFAAHLREPEINPAPAGIEDRRMKIYRDLIYNNIEGFIASAFPIMRKLYQDAQWHAMIRDFIHRHQSQTPYFLEISEEFIDYLESERGQHPDDPVFLLELARYEWAELALFVADERIPDDELDDTDSLLDHIPLLSPLAWSMVFQFPVQKIGPDYRPEQPDAVPTCIVVYRNREDQVKFLDANPVTARLLELCEGNKTGRALLEQIATELNSADPVPVINGGADTLAQLRSLDIIVGRKHR